jgi:xanthine dehydrogenase small subunit
MAVKFIMRADSADCTFQLNGRAVSPGAEAPWTNLLDFLRTQGLTGAKEGCAEGECGACAVLFVCPDGETSRYRSVNSCLVPLPAVADREVLTVEALASSGVLHEAQRAMAAGGGSQCGYCTPGFVVSMVAEQYRPKTGACDVHALGGNLCRCTGYRPIHDALKSLGAPEDGVLKERMQRPAPALLPVNYEARAGRFSRPGTLAECLRLADDPAVRFVAGNTDLGIGTNLRGERYPHLVSLEGCSELRFFHESADGVEIGAALTLTEVSERWTGAPPFIHDWLLLFASLPIRNRATLGGNLATASPIGDSAPLLLALDASLRLVSQAGERVLPLSEFFLAYRRTALAPGEIIHSILIPKPLPELLRFYKVAKRRMDDISTVAAAIAMRRDSAGRVETARIGLGGVAAIPWRARDAERAIAGTRFERADVQAAGDALAASLKPIGDHRGSAAYRLAMAQSLLGKFREEAFV